MRTTLGEATRTDRSGEPLLFRHQGWRRTTNIALGAVLAGPCIVALVGGPGVGKTLWLRDLAQTLRRGGATVIACTAGDLPADRPADAALAVDDADHLDDTSLAMLVRDPPAARILTGGPDLIDRLLSISPGLTALTLLPLASDDIGAFVGGDLAREGYPFDFATDDAMRALARLSEGVPRRLSRLGRAAALLASRLGDSHLDASHVERVEALRATPSAPSVDATRPVSARPSGRAPLAAGVVLAALLLAVVAAAALRPDRASAPAPAPADAPARAMPRAATEATPPVTTEATPPAAPAVATPPTRIALAPPATPFTPPASAPPAAPRRDPEVAVILPAIVVPPPAPEPAPPASIAPAAIAPVVIAPVEMPQAAPGRIHITFPPGDAGALAEAQRLRDRLRARGMAVDEPLPAAAAHGSAEGSADPSVRYHYMEDAETARAIGRTLHLAAIPALRIDARRGPPAPPGAIDIDLGSARSGGDP